MKRLRESTKKRPTDTIQLREITRKRPTDTIQLRESTKNRPTNTIHLQHTETPITLSLFINIQRTPMIIPPPSLHPQTLTPTTLLSPIWWMNSINYDPCYYLFLQYAEEHSLCSIAPFPRLNMCFVSNHVVCSLFASLPMDIGREPSYTPSRKESVPKRMCQTCGLLLTLDHFISLYTESSTANCDLCRKKQREAYRGWKECIEYHIREAAEEAEATDIATAQSLP